MKINLKDIKPEIKIKPLRMIVYGGSGIGKSTLAACAPAPFFADVEDGSDTIVRAGVSTKTPEAVFALIEQLIHDEHDFKTFVIDSIDWLERLMKEKIIRVFNQNHGASATSIAEIGGFGVGYTLLEKEIHKLIEKLDELREKRKMHIILLAHEVAEGKTVNDLVNGSYTKIDLKLEKKSISLLSEWSDMILYATRDISIKVDGPRNKGAKAKAEFFGRILYTNDSGRFRAKNRLGLPEKIDMPLEDPWGPLSKEIKAAYAALKSSSNELFTPEPTIQENLTVAVGTTATIN